MASSSIKERLSAVHAEPGRPLYETVKTAIVSAIDAGQFTPQQRLPSTKELSKQLSVSLVTAHRALRELVDAGILDRTQGRGTYVTEHRSKLGKKVRCALLLHREASLSDFYHSRLLEGMHQASNDQGIELTITHYGSVLSRKRDGYLMINPLPEELDQALEGIERSPALVVGARSRRAGVQSADVDNLKLAAMAVEHLHSLGHRKIGYIGNEPRLSNSRDRWEGFQDNMNRLGLPVDQRYVIHVAGASLTSIEKMHVHRLLRAPDRPTALFAGGYDFALDVYEAATTLGLTLPQDLSVVGVDNPSSAAHLNPPLTTVHQPLIELGQVAVNTLAERLRMPDYLPEDQILQPELVIRRSAAPLAR